MTLLGYGDICAQPMLGVANCLLYSYASKIVLGTNAIMLHINICEHVKTRRRYERMRIDEKNAMIKSILVELLLLLEAKLLVLARTMRMTIATKMATLDHL